MPRVSVRAIVVKDEKILLSRYRDDRGYWHVTPGGGVEHGETVEEAGQTHLNFPF
jgi:8-oxo-dGTP diphosphatase